MLRQLLLLSFFASAARADYTVRIVTVRVPELAALRAGLQYSASEGDALRRECLPYFAAPVCDMLVRCPEGRAKAEALAETPYPTEFDPLPQFGGCSMPSSFAVRNCGYTAEIWITKAPGISIPLARVDWQQLIPLKFVSFPLISSAGKHSVVQPMLVGSTLGAILPVTGQWHLLGITQPIVQKDDPFAGPPSALMTFARVMGKTSPPPARVTPPPSLMCLMTFRLPAAEAPSLALRPQGEDNALLLRLLDRTAAGEISLIGYNACTAPVRWDVRPPPPPPVPADPFAAPDSPPPNQDAGLSSTSSASVVEYPYPTEREPDPRAFASRNTGRTLTFSGPDLKWEWVDPSPAQIPRCPAEMAPGITDPEFTGESLHTQARLEPGEARLAGIHLLPPGNGPRMMDLHIIKSAGSAPVPSRPPGEVHCAVYSLAVHFVERLKSRSGDRMAAEVEALAAAGDARLLGWLSVSVEQGETANANRSAETPSGAGSKVHRHGGICLPVGMAIHTLGESLSVSLTKDGGKAAGKFEVTLTRPAAFSAAELESAGATGVPLPAFTPAKMTAEFGTGPGFPAPGRPDVVFPVPPDLPAGHPEAGRGFVAVIHAR